MTLGNEILLEDGSPLLLEEVVTGSVPPPTGAPPVAPTTVGCEPWEVKWCDDCEAASSASPVIVDFAVRAATEVLWGLTGRQFGLCTFDNLRPCRRECPGYFSGYPTWTGQWTYPQPLLYGGRWFNLTCGGCLSDCSCTSVSEFVLPGPVHDIVQIKLDGVIMPASSYRIDNKRLVVRVDGGTWPLCNDLTENDGPGTLVVSARFGTEPPTIAALALGELANEIVKGCTGAAGCQLPTRFLTGLVRQGVNMSFADPGMYLDHGLLGLDLCDLMIRTFNPGGISQRAVIYSPDALPVRRVST